VSNGGTGLPEPALAWLERTSGRVWWPAGLMGCAGPLVLAAVPQTGTAVDVGLVGLAAAAPLVAWSAQRPVYRFRARLGRGRRAVRPQASVCFEDDRGARHDLQPTIAAADLVGPFTLLCPDPERRCAGPGTFVVHLACEAEGRRWEATARLGKAQVQEGWFGGLEPRANGVRFTAEWSAIVGPRSSRPES
jgi:hypothetical protein